MNYNDEELRNATLAFTKATTETITAIIEKITELESRVNELEATSTSTDEVEGLIDNKIEEHCNEREHLADLDIESIADSRIDCYDMEDKVNAILHFDGLNIERIVDDRIDSFDFERIVRKAIRNILTDILSSK